jgi:hypothetical protein
VLPEELKVIEMYLAALLDQSFERVGLLKADKTASETVKSDIDCNDIDKQLLARANVIAKMGFE